MRTSSLLSLLGAVSWVTPAVAAHARCESLYVDVATTPGATTDQAVYAEYCAPSHRPPRALQILIHGGSYDHRYWDPPAEISRHSYVQHATRRGYATLNLDRVGVGYSSHPTDPSNLDLHAGAFTIHQLVTKLRAGELQTSAFGPLQPEIILLTGFSLGSFIATIESATYDDVDGLMLQSYSHVVGPAGEASFNLAYPANFEARFSGLDDEYFTTLPGVRPQLFFHTEGVAASVLNADEVLKQTYTLAELVDIFPSLEASFSVTAPTFVVVGDYDLIACEAPTCSTAGSLDDESSAFPQSVDFSYAIIPDVGHTMNWHDNAPAVFRAMSSWANSFVESM